ncbi:adenylosuccinate lyase [Methanolacinia petrolearia DSM 11571]|uniref:Adenylosuccinate lyase n=1 Tax=Methanolacinia petrolearia (strain DSM 11571 / OCM 486 / SEBR 4847) TaxID=679926 RepID=E1RJ00_METP4|nr:adenylosuccinate lyase [Methanolacinia petrolearia]ADN36670.1 adenylosuccinate lyase [Methanolacinia petrolearia DSM 11571]
MAIHPIDFRYGTPDMKAVWSEENRFAAIVKSEVALAKAQAKHGMIPIDASEDIAAKAKTASLERAKEIENEINHDMMSIVRAVTEVCGDSGRWIHYGATSNDILDTATGIQVKESLFLIEAKLRALLAILLKRADETKNLVCAGRTHGQIGVPTTYGLRFAIWASEVGRHIERLEQLRPRVAVGQMTGAVGTMAAMGDKGYEVMVSMMEYLELYPVDVSNQIIQRDRYAEYFMLLANIATTLDKIGIEIRMMQRSEIGEMEESFGKMQVGSSTMPHKRNPIKSEQVCGLARIVRSFVEPSLLNNTLWDERDLTNSSCERVTFPESSILADHILAVMIKVLDGVKINEANIRRNLNLLHGVNMAESVMIELTKSGMDRQEAHELIRVSSMTAIEVQRPLAGILMENETVAKYLSEERINELLDPENYIGTAVWQVENVIKKLTPLSI